jgi:hypothetical protein
MRGREENLYKQQKRNGHKKDRDASPRRDLPECAGPAAAAAAATRARTARPKSTDSNLRPRGQSLYSHMRPAPAVRRAGHHAGRQNMPRIPSGSASNPSAP